MRAEVNEKCPLPSMVIICNNYPYSGGRGERHTEELSLEPAKHADLGGLWGLSFPLPSLPAFFPLSFSPPPFQSFSGTQVPAWVGDRSKEES
jgi:hypothetical protein